jgi:vancomycin aglycone glucosyltransferase
VLFTRVAAIVHHGDAGMTTAAALPEKPPVIVAMKYDQHD